LRASGDFGNHAPEGGMLVGLRQYDVRQNRFYLTY
jgi:hypothetical protein